MDESIRNFKDFLQHYNLMSDICFKRCVDNFNGRTLDENESKCVEDCAKKLINCNNKLMRTFVRAQGVIMNQRIQEMEKQASAEHLPENSETTVTAKA